MDTLPSIHSLVEQRQGCGFLMLSSKLQGLHWDKEAWELCRMMEAGDGPLATPVVDLAKELVELLEIRCEPKDWEQFQVRRLVKKGSDCILLTGIGLPDPRGLEDSRLLILVEQIGRRQTFTLEDAKEQFGFTTRETEVIRHLMKGWTNKEIAHAIAISEQTVKEHIKHIMDKTKTTTRTGILAAVLHG
jgi:DNA-binding CsgD family transcriptional regulator